MLTDAAATAWLDLEAICATGGRFAGTESEVRAREFLARRLHEVCGVEPVEHRVEYAGWRRGEGVLERLDEQIGPMLCVPLVRSPATPAEGLAAEVVDLGRGTAADFKHLASSIAGRIALVRHEYMFAANTVHRRRKYQWAVEHGACGFLIASHIKGELPVTGSSGATPGHGIPAAGISAETAARLSHEPGNFPRVRLRIEIEDTPGGTENLVVDLPGRGPERIVLCAHLDGHHLGQSALDNASGLAAVLAVAGVLAPRCEGFERGLRIIFFSVEEWALTGSRLYVEGLDASERDAIALVFNLDSVAGSPRLSALTSGFARAESFLTKTARTAGFELGAHRPLMANSDHYNFATHGIPAVRLVAGFDEPDSRLKYVLTAGDTLDKVRPEELAGAVKLTAELVRAACMVPELALRESGECT